MLYCFKLSKRLIIYGQAQPPLKRLSQYQIQSGQLFPSAFSPHTACHKCHMSLTLHYDQKRIIDSVDYDVVHSTDHPGGGTRPATITPMKQHPNKLVANTRKLFDYPSYLLRKLTNPSYLAVLFIS